MCVRYWRIRLADAPESLTGALAKDCNLTRRLVCNSKCPNVTPSVILEGREPCTNVYDIPFGALELIVLALSKLVCFYI
jgi:hypothetical protein